MTTLIDCLLGGAGSYTSRYIGDLFFVKVSKGVGKKQFGVEFLGNSFANLYGSIDHISNFA